MPERPVIIVFRIGQLGDTLVSVPAVRAIRAAHPDADLQLVTDRHPNPAFVSSWEVFAATGWFSGVHFFSPTHDPRELLHLASRLRQLRSRRLYYLPPMPRTTRQVLRDRLFFRVLCGIRDLVGVRPTGPYPARGLNGSLPRLAHESERLLAWIAGDLPTSAPPLQTPWLHPTPTHWRRAEHVLAEAGVFGRALVAVAPGSKMATKRWPEECFSAVGQALLARFPEVGLAVFGGHDDRALGERLCRAWGGHSLNLAGRLGVWESAAALQRCHLYIGNDTGTMHLAASVGTRCVAIFSARDNPGRWEPVGEGHTVLRRDVPCAGCALTTCATNGLVCLRQISVDTVVHAAAAHLAETFRQCRRQTSRG